MLSLLVSPPSTLRLQLLRSGFGPLEEATKRARHVGRADTQPNSH